MARHRLCAASSLIENQTRGFALGDRPDRQDVFVIQRDGVIYAYRNSCPHTGVSMNWQDDNFMDLEGFYLMCSVHGARFVVENGRCVWGPCLNQSLQRLDTEIVQGELFVEFEPR